MSMRWVLPAPTGPWRKQPRGTRVGEPGAAGGGGEVKAPERRVRYLEARSWEGVGVTVCFKRDVTVAVTVILGRFWGWWI